MFLTKLFRGRGNGSPSSANALGALAACEALESRRLFAAYYGWDIGYEETAAGVTAEWWAKGARLTNFDFVLTQDQPAVELRLSGLPQHYFLDYSANGDWGIPQSESDVDTITAAGPGGSDTTLRDGGINAGMSYSVGHAGAHTGSDATITFSAAQLEEGDQFQLHYGGVGSFDPVVTVDPEDIVTGETEQVVVTVKGPGGKGISGVEVSVDDYDGEYIDPQQMSGTTDGNGEAVFDVKGLNEVVGFTTLQVSILNGAIVRAAEIAVRHPLVFASQLDSIYVGQENITEVVVRNPFTLQPMEDVIVWLQNGPGEDYVEIEDPWQTTVDTGAAYFTSFGQVPTPAAPAPPTQLRVVLPSSGFKTTFVNIEVKAVKVEILNPGVVRLSMQPGGQNPWRDTITVKVVNPANGAPLKGIRIKSQLADPLVNVWGGASKVTDDNGVVFWDVSSAAVGVTAFVVWAGYVADAEDEITIIVEQL